MSERVTMWLTRILICRGGSRTTLTKIILAVVIVADIGIILAVIVNGRSKPADMERAAVGLQPQMTVVDDSNGSTLLTVLSLSKDWPMFRGGQNLSGSSRGGFSRFDDPSLEIQDRRRSQIFTRH